ncbi:uncharacterized protein EAE97_000033 [Botrytis byssoidea]|uniref:Uncharacterized protein n=1 Tax=Botrytis byssoidea TaxID=139641 RepID=A0A9P5IXK4_9HELO|nr:uncharacterized protein EAE97_000033 [Botrytis byssoidea]KAF7954774.1 hypothetical protein EAE97_000033 [Botrytis byssoidea]
MSDYRKSSLAAFDRSTVSHGKDREGIDQLPDEQSHYFLNSRVEFRHFSDFVCGCGLRIFSSHLTEPIVLSTQCMFYQISIGRTSRRRSSKLAQLPAQSHIRYLNLELASAGDLMKGESSRGDCSSGRADARPNRTYYEASNTFKLRIDLSGCMGVIDLVYAKFLMLSFSRGV